MVLPVPATLLVVLRGGEESLFIPCCYVEEHRAAGEEQGTVGHFVPTTACQVAPSIAFPARPHRPNSESRIVTGPNETLIVRTTYGSVHNI